MGFDYKIIDNRVIDLSEALRLLYISPKSFQRSDWATQQLLISRFANDLGIIDIQIIKDAANYANVYLFKNEIDATKFQMRADSVFRYLAIGNEQFSEYIAKFPYKFYIDRDMIVESYQWCKTLLIDNYFYDVSMDTYDGIFWFANKDDATMFKLKFSDHMIK